MTVRRSTALAAAALLAAAACSRTPPEPAPSTTATPSSGAVTAQNASAAPASSGGAPAAQGAPSRCVTKLPAAAPKTPDPAPAGKCPPDPEPKTLPLADVGFPDAPGKPRVKVELATSDEQVQKGLMYRTKMAEDAGMLFKLSDRRDHTFWMHNTCIPLDMMFVDEDGLIVGISESAEPLTDTTRSVGCPSVYVLEVNAGWSRRHGVAPGQKLGLPAAIR